MTNVIVITGGTGGMGFATARKLSSRENTVILLADLNGAALANAKTALAGQAATIETVVCDITSEADVTYMADTAANLGHISGVIHTAGVSPSMGDYRKIIAINALGTVNVDQAFIDLTDHNFSLVNVASMAGYMLPKMMIPKHAYKTVDRDSEILYHRLLQRCQLLPKNRRAQMAYPLSKNFVMWYTEHISPVYGSRGAHVVSVSPGSFDTSMGRLEKDKGAGAMVNYAAIKRFGTPQEVGDLLAYLVTDAPAYLTGTDILIDGGVVGQLRLRDMLSLT
ncbi:SDR family oxidoreductase [Secundilactobacillus paracollinoides]|nr:SDR family oxidoreductase [Secundilactobacillus paracollinoides]